MPYGMNSHLHLNFQNSFGTAQVTSMHAVPIISSTLAKSIEQVLEGGMYARYGESPRHEGGNMVQGDIQMEGHPIAIGHLLKSGFGQVTTVTSTNGVNKHVFTPRTADFDDRAAGHPMTAVEYFDNGSAAQYHSLVGNNLSMEIANKELLKVTLGVMGTGFSRVAATTPTFPAGLPFIWDSSSASYNSAAINDLRSLTFGVNNNLEAQYTLTSSKLPYRIIRTAPYQVTVGGTLQFESHSYWQAFEAQSEVNFTYNLAGQFAAHNLQVIIPKMRFTEFAPQISGPGQIEVSFNAIGAYDTTSSTAIMVILINSQTYY